MRRRNTKKERKGRRESPERLGRSRSMGSPLHKEQEEVALRMVDEGRRMLEEEQDTATMSMWCCRRCTLDNPLQESTCLACGGSRLSSIGDIVEPVMVPPTQARSLLKGEEQEQGVEQEQGQEARSWYCVVCTLENPALAYYCDACNTQSPLKTLKDLQALTSKQDGSPTRQVIGRAARYFAIACFMAIIAMSVFNMVLGIFSALATFSSSFPGQAYSYTPPTGQASSYTAPPPPPTAPPGQFSLPAPPPSPSLEEAKAPPGLEELFLAPAMATSQEEVEDTAALLETLVTQSCLGLHPFLLLLLSPLFLLLLSQPPAPPAPRVPQPGARLNLLLNDPTLWRTEEQPDKQTNWQAGMLKAGFALFTIGFWVGFVYYG